MPAYGRNRTSVRYRSRRLEAVVFTWADPDTNIYSSNFGKSQNNDQLANTYGLRTQLGLRIEF